MQCSDILDTLQVPPEFLRHDHITEREIISRLADWRNQAYCNLAELRELLGHHVLSIQEQARVISTIVVFDGDFSWSTDDMRELACDILSSFSTPSSSLLIQVLSHHLRPLFQSNPHPSLNLSTGRKLARQAGGSLASHDYYDNQNWKQHPGSSELVLWCVQNIQSNAYEEIWHLIIPPVMTLLDDYEVSYRLRGIQIVSKMLKVVPKEVLCRTGIDTLFLSSLSTSFHHVQDPKSPSLLRAAISTALSLIELTTAENSTRRFDQLCSMLGEGVIGSVWLYASHDPDVILATVESIPPVIRMLGTGSARYLKAIIPQLIHPLIPNPLNPSPTELQISSAFALSVIVEECAPRMNRWKGTILEGVAKCWVTIMNTQSTNKEFIQLKLALRDVCDALTKACPSVIQEDYTRLLTADPMFKGLLDRSNAE